MMIKIISVVGLVLILFLSYVALKPSQMKISRELLIHASAEKLFPYINNSKKANEWMPWSEVDPQVKMNYSGPEEGVNAKSSWESPGQMGTGEALVLESIPNQVVKTQLTYTKPMEMSQLAEVSLTPTADGTLVRWGVTGENSFLGRFFCTFIDMDKAVGTNFEKGLNNLKVLVEKDK